ncbi:hypothetical protein D3C73_651760 [compost metagenome]
MVVAHPEVFHLHTSPDMFVSYNVATPREFLIFQMCAHFVLLRTRNYRTCLPSLLGVLCTAQH